jgi:hypothetical protein
MLPEGNDVTFSILFADRTVAQLNNAVFKAAFVAAVHAKLDATGAPVAERQLRIVEIAGVNNTIGATTSASIYSKGEAQDGDYFDNLYNNLTVGGTFPSLQSYGNFTVTAAKTTGLSPCCLYLALRNAPNTDFGLTWLNVHTPC